MTSLLAHNGYWDHGGGAHPLAWAFFALLLFVVVVGVVALVAWLARERAAHPVLPRPPAAGPPEGDALAVLRMRYARGEITRDEFLSASADLGAAPPPPPAPPAA